MAEQYKALTDWQPWASLIITGRKGIETRGWATSYRGVIAVHAAKKLSESARIWTRATPEIGAALSVPVEELPVGAMLGTVELVNCQRVVSVITRRNPINGAPHIAAILENGQEVSGPELAFGDYTVGRWAWILRNPRPLAEPMPVRGRQGLWTWEPEGELKYAVCQL